MQVIYASMTGNVRRFAAKLGRDAVPIEAGDALEPFVLITYTFGFGAVPDKVATWLEKNHKYMRGVAVSGNRNWGSSYGRAGDLIAAQYNVPLLLKFELSGSAQDAQLFNERAASL